MPLDDEFFARVGHDLRGELATMLAGVHYLLRYEKQVSPTARDMLGRVVGAGDRLKHLLDELDAAVWLRPDPSRPMSIASYDVLDVVRDVVGRLEGASAARGVRIALEAEGGVPAGLRGDAALLRLALEQVIGLAVTRSRDSVVRVELSAGPGGAAAVRVIDEAGAVPVPLDRLLEPFGERAAIPPDPVAPRRRERLGLGLSIARGILEAHGGGLSVEASGVWPNEKSEAPARGAGLRFTCTLGDAPTVAGDEGAGR